MYMYAKARPTNPQAGDKREFIWKEKPSLIKVLMNRRFFKLFYKQKTVRVGNSRKGDAFIALIFVM